MTAGDESSQVMQLRRTRASELEVETGQDEPPGRHDPRKDKTPATYYLLHFRGSFALTHASACQISQRMMGHAAATSREDLKSVHLDQATRAR